jgi:uncharacterized protein
MLTNDGFRVLDREECLRLLAAVPVGRVVYTRHALPAVLPVNFTLDQDAAILVRTAANSDLTRAIHGVVVAFEADDFDTATRSGWSVIVTGHAAVVTDPAEHTHLPPPGPDSWRKTPDQVLVRIEPEMISGRELPANP